MEIEHCCILTEGHQDKLWFVTRKAADWETATFSFIDGGHFDHFDTHGRISLDGFSWYAAVWKGIMSLFSVRYCIKVYQKSVALTTKYFYLILIKNLEVHVQVYIYICTAITNKCAEVWYYFIPQAIETRYERQNELCGSEVTFEDDSDQVLLDIDKDGETTKNGWHIIPCTYPPLVRSTISLKFLFASWFSSAYSIHLRHTVIRFRLLQPYFAFLSVCAWYMKFKDCLRYELGCSWEASIIWFVSTFRKPTNQHF